MLSRVPAGETLPLHYHSDHLGSPRLITGELRGEEGGEGEATVASNRSGLHNGVHGAFNYFPYGEKAFGYGQAGALRFTGHERDGSGPLALDYMHARHASPFLGRFLSTDPIGGTTQLPQSWNRYAYVMGRGTVASDPTGEFANFILLAGVCGQGYCTDDWINVVASPWRSLGWTDSSYELNELSQHGLIYHVITSLFEPDIRTGFGLLDVEVARGFYDNQAANAETAAGAAFYQGVNFMLPESQGELAFDLASTFIPPLKAAKAGKILRAADKAADIGGGARRAGAAAAQGGRRARKGLQRQLDSHLKKLEDFRVNPDKFDNKGFLKNAPSQEIREQIIEGRVRSLQKQIDNFRRQIEKAEGGG